MKVFWKKAQIDYVVEHYANTATPVLADAVGRTVKSVHELARRLQLRKSAEYLKSPLAGRLTGTDGRGRASRFTKGQAPWNAGMKGLDLGGRSHETRFKKGTITGAALERLQPVGTYRINCDMLQMKFCDTPGSPHLRWRSVHRLVWEAENGPVPSGHVVVFKAGRHSTDLEKITLDAVELVTRVELMRRNSIHTRLPPELAQVAILRGALVRQINQRLRA